jgi:uncharacterized protein (TIGR02246 family)
MRIAICSLLIAIGATMARADNEMDKSALAGVVSHFMDAWDRHDAHAVASLFVENADFTNVRGKHQQRRTNVEEFLTPLFAGMLKNSRLTGQLRSLRFLKPDVAIVDIDWEMTGQTTSSGVPGPPIKGLLDWALTKAHGRWLIAVMHNAELMGNAVPTPVK